MYISQEADIAAGALSVKPTRIQYVDFSHPFMEVGIATVVKKSTIAKLSFDSPYVLANRSDIAYGLIPGSQTYHYFRLSNHSAISKMWSTMSKAEPSVFEWSSRKGVDRVRSMNGTYAFFLESSFAQYLASESPCDVTYLKEYLSPSEYALALRQNGPLKTRINKALSKLKDSGILDKIKDKWWKKKCVRTKSMTKDEKLVSQKQLRTGLSRAVTTSTVSLSTSYPTVVSTTVERPLADVAYTSGSTGQTGAQATLRFICLFICVYVMAV